MHSKITFGALVVLLLASACSPGVPAASPTSILLPATATETAEPSETPTPTPQLSIGPKVIYDFLELACQAKWTNNGQDLPCPGEQFHIIGPGYVGVIEDALVESDLLMNVPVLLTHPSSNGSFYGIFGAYPPISIKEGDQFMSGLACLEGIEASGCTVQFALEYYDENGAYFGYEATGWEWTESQDGVINTVQVDLSPLAGQSVQLTLVVRDEGSPAGDYAVWIGPQLLRK